MTATVHAFRAKLDEGKAAEAELDAYLSRRAVLQDVSLRLDKAGIDRIAIRNGVASTIQYKADTRAATTGNGFVELVSSDIGGAPGWAYTCAADWLLYWVPPTGLLLWIRPDELRKHISAWYSSYPLRPARNPGYFSIGLAVPMDVLRGVATREENTLVAQMVAG